MASTDGERAVDKVFAIPELLEHILLCFPRYWGCTTMIYPSRRHLFVLQRVNRTFQNTILGSNTLKRAMRLAHFFESYPERLYVLKNAIGHERNVLGHFALIDSRTVNDGGILGLRLEFIMWADEPRSPSLPSWAYPNASWRRLRLTEVPLPIRVAVRVKWSDRPMIFEETFEIKSAQDSLGDLASTLESLLEASLKLRQSRSISKLTVTH